MFSQIKRFRRGKKFQQAYLNLCQILKPKTDSNILLAAGWIPVEKLPDKNMPVEWLCEDGTEDIGFYFSKQKEFSSWDLRSLKPITHWKPLGNE